MTSPSSRNLTLSASTPEDILAAVPVVLSFEPEHSVVMLTFGGIDTFHARVDLPPPRLVDDAVESLLEPARALRVAQVLFVVYADDGPTVRTMSQRLRRAFERAGIDVLELLRAYDGRWFAPHLRGVPREGVPYDVEDHRFRAQAVVQGIVVHRSRADLEAVLQPRAEAVAEVERVLVGAAPSPPGELADLVACRLDGGRFTDAELARLLLGLAEWPGEEAARAAITRGSATRHVRLWTDAVQRAPDALVAEPAALLGLAAWLAGQGALSWCAVQRCLDAEPDHRLAHLVAHALSRAVPPSAWELVEAG